MGIKPEQPALVAVKLLPSYASRSLALLYSHCMAASPQGAALLAVLLLVERLPNSMSGQGTLEMPGALLPTLGIGDFN